MGSLHPATQLLIYLVLFLVLGMPLLAWFAVVRHHRDVASQWWYGGLAVSGLGVVMVAVLQRASAYTACLIVLSVLLCIRAIRHEGVYRQVAFAPVAVGYGVYAALALFLEWMGAWQRLGVPFFLSTLLVTECVLLYGLVRVGRRYGSRGLVVVAVGLVTIMPVNFVRVVHALVQGHADTIFSFTWMSNAAIMGTTVSEVLMTLGYAIFTLEKANLRHLKDVEDLARAQEQQRLAHEHAAELQGIIAQRDEMILVNSRFSAISNLALFNSAIVHEISQPLQGLTSILDLLALKPSDPDLKLSVEHAQALVGKMATTLHTLRGLMAAQPPVTQVLELNEVLQELLPIVRNEARRRGHAIQDPAPADAGPLPIQVNKVLLERVVLNLFSNAFEALEDTRHTRTGPGSSGQVVWQTHSTLENGVRFAVLEVEDNGPGMPADILETGGQPYRTHKADGVGLGLALARTILESWRGRLELVSPVPGLGSRGARVVLCMPMAAAGTPPSTAHLVS